MHKVEDILPALRMMLSDEQVKTIKFEANCFDKCDVTIDLSDDSIEKAKSAINDFIFTNNKLPATISINTVGKVTVDNDKINGRMAGKVVVVTGGAQGFGGGIVDYLMSEGAHVVVADLNSEVGMSKVALLNQHPENNRAIFTKVDVSEAESVEQMVDKVVREFGGIDVLISNAGILRAGGLDEMTPDTFQLMTNVNYSGYFFCAKYVSKVMKIQNELRHNYFTDIIQINSKSGLKGSNRNFTYAGGKFGGIGLTQSFALELMPHRIKVNSICPGNFFDGPLWADPENGLFVQYLKTGKVPGAQTIEDVRTYYEQQVPAQRGCMPLDVMRAIYYVVEQEYETGQAIPVTGGQQMLK